jgi:hypothetical protein
MMTLRQFSREGLAVPGGTAWSLTDLGEALGKQALFTRQSPQRLKVLREHALIESAVSSNRIEGGVGRDWIQTLLRDMKAEKLVRSFGHGAGAKWERVGKNKGSTLK